MGCFFLFCLELSENNQVNHGIFSLMKVNLMSFHVKNKQTDDTTTEQSKAAIQSHTRKI